MNLNSVCDETLGNKCSFCPKYFPSFIRKRNHESMEHYVELQELMESMGVKARITFLTPATQSNSDNDQDKRNGVSVGMKRKITSADNQSSTNGELACPLCTKFFKTHQTLKIHVEKKHPDSKSYSLRCRNSDSSPETSGTSTASKRLELRAGHKIRKVKSDRMQMFKRSRTKDSGNQNGAFAGVPQLQTWTHFSFSEHQTSSVTKAPEPLGVPIVCNICREIFYGDLYLQWHIRHEHPQNLHTGLLGLNQSKNENYSATPVEGTFSTNSCRTEITVGTNPQEKSHPPSPVAMHKKWNRSAQKTYSCSRCPIKFYSHPKLVAHLSLHRKRITRTKTANVGQIQEFRAKTPSELKLENDIYTSNKSTTSNSTSSFRYVQGQDREKGVFYCPFCDFKLISLTDVDLEKHVSSEHMDIQGPISCLHCPLEYTGPLLLLDHIRVHVKERPFCCAICDKKFRQFHEKLTHEVEHMDSNDGYSCTKCGCCYLTPASLERHITEQHS